MDAFAHGVAGRCALLRDMALDQVEYYSSLPRPDNPSDAANIETAIKLVVALEHCPRFAGGDGDGDGHGDGCRQAQAALIYWAACNAALFGDAPLCMERLHAGDTVALRRRFACLLCIVLLQVATTSEGRCSYQHGDVLQAYRKVLTHATAPAAATAATSASAEKASLA